MLTRTTFGNIHGWYEDQHEAAYDTFLNSCRQFEKSAPKTGSFGISSDSLRPICENALNNPNLSGDEARVFFEKHFDPIVVEGFNNGFLTGYYEPLVEGALNPTNEFGTPLYKHPPDLIRRPPEIKIDQIDSSFEFVRRTPSGFEYFPDRKAIDEGALSGLGLELVYVRSSIEAYFIHLQGSARINLAEGGLMRITFVAKNGHPYTPIGRLLIEGGHIAREEMTADRLRSWLENNETAAECMAKNQSYIFFKEIKGLDADRGPIAAAGVPLVAGRSLAVDRKIHTFSTPVWVDTNLPESVFEYNIESEKLSFGRLMIAQDTGSAIVGPARGDVFVGTGEAAAKIAGRIKHPATLTVLAPKSFRCAGEV